MGKVFISYRQLDDAHRLRVRTFAERIRAGGIEVILDQFYLDTVPGGPPEGWDKWSSDRALETDYVIIIGTEAWFQCFEKKQKPGTGLGAACEADDIRHRIFKGRGEGGGSTLASGCLRSHSAAFTSSPARGRGWGAGPRAGRHG